MLWKRVSVKLKKVSGPLIDEKEPSSRFSPSKNPICTSSCMDWMKLKGTLGYVLIFDMTMSLNTKLPDRHGATRVFAAI